MLELRGISFDVVDKDGTKKSIVKKVDLTVGDGRFVVVTGPNGGGKSTLAKLIAGIETPTAGSILMDGVDVTAKSITERARMGLGFAFQQPVRFKGIRVLDLLRIAAGRELSLSHACDYLSQVGLCAKNYIKREVNDSLSGGELKRIEIATVLARKPRIAIFDEPEAGIDLWSFNNLITIFASMREAIKDSSIVVISHQERILNIADEIAVMKQGSIEKLGPRREIFPLLTSLDEAQASCEKVKTL
ncbi:MAG: ATP-binding cassette domain-containing protein [Desulfovibrio sp.]|nr:ATP-binding cassette domain-containing protein [Desulfovibrio sp.]